MESEADAGVAVLIREFQSRYRRDSERGLDHSLAHYLALYPQFAGPITEHYVALESARVISAPAATPSREPSKEPLHNDGRLLIDLIDQTLANDDEDDHSATLPVHGPYRALRLLGQGGEGVVYEAEDQRAPDRRIALKVLSGSAWLTKSDLARFRESTQLAAARLNHRHICPIHDMGLDASPPWVAMRFIAGETLREFVERAAREERGPGAEPNDRPRLPAKHTIDRILEIGEKVARALEFAHRNNIVHRDIKPANIMVEPDGEPSILDFGLARPIESNDATRTRAGAVLGTLPYLAPELLSGAVDRANAQTDLWALGVTLYECLTGERPFDGKTPHQLIHAIHTLEPRDPRRLNPALGRDVKVFMELCLQKNPIHRYGSAGAVAEELARLQRKEPLLGKPPGFLVRAQRWCQRNPRLALSFAALLAAVIVLVVLSLALTRSRRDLDDETIAARADVLTLRSDALIPEKLLSVTPLEQWQARSRPFLERLAEASFAGTSRDRDRESLARLAQKERAIELKIGQTQPLVDALKDGAWERWRAHVAAAPKKTKASRLIPAQVGVLPLGIDADSGLTEFWVLGTGDQPVWEGSFERGRVRTDAGSAIVMVLIPEATFTMGPNSHDFAPLPDYLQTHVDANPAQYAPHEVSLPAYFIAKFETTEAQWQRLLLRLGTADPTNAFLDSEKPMTRVTWLQCDEVARAWNLTIPTEAQWERAARGGTSLRYGVTDDTARLEEFAWYRTNSTPNAHDPDVKPVGTKLPNSYGLYDTLGNAYEWCDDVFLPYADTTVDPVSGRRIPRRPEQIRLSTQWVNGRFVEHRAVRGGGVNDLNLPCSIIYRGQNSAIQADNGIRFARPVK